MAIIIFVEIIWLLAYLLHLVDAVSLTVYIVGAIVIFAVGLCIWNYCLKRREVRKKIKEKDLLEYGYVVTDEQIRQLRNDPYRRNQKRGRGPRSGKLDQASCEICGAYTGNEKATSIFHSNYLCDNCEQRYLKAQKNGQIPYITGYTDDKINGKCNSRKLWVVLQITAIDLMDGVIDEQMAKSEIETALEKGRQWARQQRTAQATEKQRQQDTDFDQEQKEYLNDEVQRLLS